VNPDPAIRSLDPLTGGREGAATYPAEAFSFLDAVEGRHFWFLARNRTIGEWLIRCIPDVRNVRILEVGCGNGTVLAYLHKLGLQVAGVDLFRTALTRCRERVRVPLYQADAMRLPFRDRFGVVGLFDCLEHFDRPEIILSEAWRVLETGGYVLVTVPAIPSLYGWVDRLSGHRQRYSRAVLMALLETSGFKVLRASYFMTGVLPAMAASRFLNELLFRNTPDEQKPFADQFKVLPGVNSMLGWICAIDRLLLRAINLPIGGSLIAVAIKK